jgi:hypothetical protein
MAQHEERARRRNTALIIASRSVRFQTQVPCFHAAKFKFRGTKSGMESYNAGATPATGIVLKYPVLARAAKP